MAHFRVTRPDLYGPGCLGHWNPGARQGYYINASDVPNARVEARKIGCTGTLDVQAWDHGPNHGRLLREDGTPKSPPYLG